MKQARLVADLPGSGRVVFDGEARQIIRPDSARALAGSAWLWRGDTLYLAADAFAWGLRLGTGIDWTEMQLRLLGTAEMPVVRRLVRDARRAVLRRPQPTPATATTVGVRRSLADGAVLDWALSSATGDPVRTASLQLGLGVQLAGGGLEVQQSLQGRGGGPNTTRWSWTWAWPTQGWLRQVRLGDVETAGPDPRAVRGAIASSAPYVRETQFGMDALAGLSRPAHLTMPANAPRFAQIVARERSRLGNFIRGQVGDAAEAEDILQDVLLEFYAATDAIEQAGAWLFRVARNRIIDRARKKKEEPLPAADDEDGRSWLEENLPDPAAGPDAAYARSVLLGSIQAALQTLPPEQRDVFVAHEIEGLSFADLSARWRVPQNTLLARKRYAVFALRARLQAEYGDLIV